MKKILIIGICGAGKSTLSQTLSRKLDLPIIHLDQQFWKKGWVEPSKEDWHQKLKVLVNKDKWIMDGNYSSSFNIRFPVADTIIYLDYNKNLALYRILKRVFSSYGKVREDMAPGCPERFDWSFMKYVWNFDKNQRPRAEEAIRNYGSDKKIIRLKSPKDLEEFLTKI